MSIQATYTKPVIELYDKPVRYDSDPQLFVVGRWANAGASTGDATGGDVEHIFHPLPATPQLPLLPKLRAWYVITQINFRQNSASMKCAIIIRSNWAGGLSTGERIAYGQYGHQQSSMNDGSDLFFYYPTPWVFDARPWLYDPDVGLGYEGFIIIFESNVNTKSYYSYAYGLLLKDKYQLVTEGLWKDEFDK